MGSEQTLTLKRCTELYAATKQVMNQPMPVKLSYRLSRLHEALEAVVQRFERHRLTIAQEFGVPDDKGGYTIDDKKLKPFTRKLAELLEEEETVKVPAFSLSLFEEVSSIPPSFFKLMGDYITDDES